MISARCVLLTCVFVVGAVACAVQGEQTQGQRLRLVPRNEALRAPGFASTLGRFETAVGARDVAAVLSLTSTSVRATLGTDRFGREAMRQVNNLDDPKSEFWSIVDTLLKDGSAIEGDCDTSERGCTVTYPYWSDRFPDDRLDRRDYWVVRLDNVPMRMAPRQNAGVVERLSYDVVRQIAQPEPLSEEWEEIALLDGRRGWLLQTELYNPTTGYRLIFVREAGEWVLGGFLAGD